MTSSRESLVYRAIREMLFRYELVPGQKLQYQDLADKLGVSRTPVKSALNLLESQGLVRLTYNKGYYVAELSREEAGELFELREILEVQAARLAVERFTEEAFLELVNKYEDYIRSIDFELNRSRFLIDRDFHLELALMSRNNALHKHLKQVIEMIFLKHRIDRLSSQRGYEAREEHNHIVQAIANRNESEAIDAVRYHIRQHRENIFSIL